MDFRVAKTSGSPHIASEFGYDPRKHGNLTPEIVHDAGRMAKVLDLQKQLASAMNRHLAKIYANKVEIERLTLEAIETGLTAKAEIDKYVSKAVIAGAKHESHIATLEHKLQHELGLIKVKEASTNTLANADFRQRLLLIKANHQAKGQIQEHGFTQSLRVIQASPRQAITMQNRREGFNAYINAKDFDPILATAGNSGDMSPIGAGNSKGFLGGLFDFFSGKK